MSNKLSKKERKTAFKKLEGWFSNKVIFEYGIPDNSIKKLDMFNVLKLKHVDRTGDYALYKCMQLLSISQLNALNGIATTVSTTSVNSHAVGLQGAVASYDRNTGQIKLEIVDMDDKTIWTCTRDGKNFRGTNVEFGLNTALQNDAALGGGAVGGFTLKKLDVAPVGFNNFNFDAVYKAQYDSVYPNNNNNNNNDTNITLESIATESPPGFWIINTDVTISPNQTLVIDPGVTVTTFHNFTNNGSFTNSGTFCTAKNFTNNANADFNNNGGTTLIYLGGTLNNDGQVYSRDGGKIINLQSTYNGNRVVGNQVVTLTY